MECVVILQKPEQGMARMPRQYFGNYSQPIHVGDNRCQCHYSAIASVQIRRIR